MRLFRLIREVDVTGTSGTGPVVEGVRFSDDSAVIHWCTGIPTTTYFPHWDQVIAVHGHEGATWVEWLGEEE